MSKLEQIIKQAITRFGPMKVSDLMRYALQYPQQGYYQSKLAIGAAQDFITAPEISPAFAYACARWIEEQWHVMQEPDDLWLVELGPGRGTLMKDCLLMLPDKIKAALKIMLIDSNRELSALQQKSLQGYQLVHKPHWSALPAQKKLVMGNEFLDALPIDQIIKHQSQWFWRALGLDPQGQFQFCLGRAYVGVLPSEAQDFNEGALLEVPTEALSLCQTLARDCIDFGGAALLIDYGSPQFESADTLQAVSKHKKVPLLENLGLADLSAHVPFAWLRASLAQSPIEITLRAQGAWLKQAAPPPKLLKDKSAWQRLTAPEQMGELFQVLTLNAPSASPLKAE